MKKTDLEKLKTLTEEFYKDCNRVAHILEGVLAWRKPDCDIFYASEFYLDGNTVYWKGNERCRGECYSHDGYFSAEYLTMSDSELKELVEEKNRQYVKEQNDKAKEIQERERAKRLAEYEKLKAEFGD